MRSASRAWRHLVRKPLKSLIIFAVLTAMSTLIMSSLAVKRATDVAGAEAGRGIMSSFTLENNPTTNPGTSRGSGTVRARDIDAIAALPDITSHLRRIDTFVDLREGQPVPVPGDASFFTGTRAQQFGRGITVTGMNDSSLATPLRTGTFTLSAGRHLTPNDHGKALVHEKFAQANNLSLGSTLKVTRNPYDTDNTTGSHASADLEIVGILSGLPKAQAQNRIEYAGNTVYSDLASAAELNGTTVDDSPYIDATFFTSSSLERTVEAARQLPIDWKKFQIAKSGDIFSGITASLTGLYSLINTTLWGSILVGAVILMLVLLLWMNERRKETAIYLALGHSRGSVLRQYLMEPLALLIPALTLAAGASTFLAQWMGASALSSVARDLARTGQTSAPLGGSAEIADVTRTIDHLNVMLSSQNILLGAAIAAAVAALAVCAATAPQLRCTPKTLFAQEAS